MQHTSNGNPDQHQPANGTVAVGLSVPTGETVAWGLEVYAAEALERYAALKAQQAEVEERAWHEHAFLALYCRAREMGLGLLQSNGQPSSVGLCLSALVGYKPELCGIAAVPERAQLILPDMLGMSGLDVLVQQWRSAYPASSYWQWQNHRLELMTVDAFIAWVEGGMLQGNM